LSEISFDEKYSKREEQRNAFSKKVNNNPLGWIWRE